MELVPEYFLEAWLLVKEHVVGSFVGVFLLFLVDIVLAIDRFGLLLEGEALDSLFLPVEDDPLVDGLR